MVVHEQGIAFSANRKLFNIKTCRPNRTQSNVKKNFSLIECHASPDNRHLSLRRSLSDLADFRLDFDITHRPFRPGDKVSPVSKPMLTLNAIHRRGEKSPHGSVENPKINAVAADAGREIALGFNESLERVKAVGYAYGDMNSAARV
jgi:hypothetical protein